MPLLKINSTKELDSEEKTAFIEDIAERYAETMDSETRFLSIVFNETARENVWLGRASGTNADIVVLEADIRAGRPSEQLRTFALEFIETVHERWEIPYSNTKVVFTEHEGRHMMGYDRVGSDWGSTQDE